MHKNTLRVFSYMTSGALFAVSTLQAQVSVKDTQTAYGREITLANEFISASFLPDWGGRMNKLVDVKSGVNVVFWDYPPDHPKWGGGWGGALDDRNGWNIKYDGDIIEQNPQTAAISLKSPRSEQGIVCEKIIRLAAHSSCLQVEYHYFNNSQKGTTGYQLAIRNFFRPSGRPPDWSVEHIFIPSVKTVREFGDKLPFPELTGKVMLEVIPTWNGFIDKKSGRGLAFSFQDDFYRWFYRWVKSETATYEWTYSPLAPGKEAVTRFSIAVTRGLEGYTDVAEKYAVHLIWKQDGGQTKITCRIFPTLVNLAGVTVKSELLSPDRKPLRNLPDVNIGPATVGAVAQGETVWEIPAQSGLILVQKVYDGGTLLGEYELPVPPDAPAKEYARAKTGRGPVVMRDIPGFKLEKTGDITQVSDGDRKRGYLVYRDYFAPDQDSRGKDTPSISLDLGRNEFESLAVKVRVLGETGSFRISSDQARLSVCVESEEEIPDAKKAGKEGIVGYRLNRRDTFTPVQGKDTAVWFIWDGRGLNPGVYTPAVTFTPEKGEPRTIPFRINVRDIAVPERNIFELEVEFYLFRGLAAKYNWDLSKVIPYIRDLGQHRVNVAGIFNGLEQMGFPPQVKPRIRASGEPLTVGKTPPDTALDLSGYDPWFDELIENGLVRAYSRQSGVQERSPVEEWHMREGARYLGEKGYSYRDRYVKFVDEQPPEEFPRMATIGKMYHALGWRVLHSTSPVKSAAQMAILNPSSDLWHGAIPDRKDREKRLLEKALDPEDEFWTYDGWGAVWKSYASRRSMPWVAAVNDLTGLHLHTYYRGRLIEDVIFTTPDGPVSSAAWEGARDGIEDVQYFELARQWLNNLAKNGVDDATLKGLREKTAALAEKMNGSLGVEKKYQQLLEAKKECFAVLETLKPYRDKITISVQYGFEPLVLDGVPRYILAGDARARETVEKTLAPLCREQMRSASWEKIAGEKNLADNVLLLLTADHPFCGKLAADGAIPMSASYPAPGSYAVWETANPASPKSKLLLIVGRDAAGLQKGCGNFLRFLRIAPQPF